MITTIVNLLTFGILFSSIISITSNNPIISIIFLITAFVNAAGYLILLGINFIGISYIVIYVGAIAVLFLFIILMINIKLTDILDTGYNFTKNLPIGLNIASLLLFIFFSVAVNLFPFLPFLPFQPAMLDSYASIKEITQSIAPLQKMEESIFLSEEITQNFTRCQQGGTLTERAGGLFDINLLEFTQIEVLGHFLYTYASIFLIILSLILLLAMLAIIIISKKNITNI
jgi:NADH-ubiquinone oxidoreductase chain 6